MEELTLTKSLVAASVVLYNSEPQVFDNIKSYADQVDKVYAIDNSELVSDDLKSMFESNPKIDYYWMGGNGGIAAALNRASKLAVNAGYEYLLMMDDDSQLVTNSVDSMIEYIVNHNNSIRIGSVTAQSDLNVCSTSAQSVWYAITSGSLLNLRAYQECGPFMDELFIDGVDHEYCYRLKKLNYQVIILNYVTMSHRMGLLEELKFFGTTIYTWSTHSPLRSYYLVRNFLFVLNKYKDVLPSQIKFEVYYGVVKACLLDLLFGKDRFLRMQYIYKAISDFRKNILGKITQTIH